MLPCEYDILSRVQSSGGTCPVSALRELSPPDYLDRLVDEFRFLEPTDYDQLAGPLSVCLTPAGADALYAEEQRRQKAAEGARQTEAQEKQADAQEEIKEKLKEEIARRAHDDKKYFWLGALVSLITALLVEYGATLLSLLQQGYLLLTQAP